MAKTKSAPTTNTLFDKPWKHGVAAVIDLVIAYGLASWSIDSGRWLAYGLTLLFVGLGINHIVRAVAKQKVGK